MTRHWTPTRRAPLGPLALFIGAATLALAACDTDGPGVTGVEPGPLAPVPAVASLATGVESPIVTDPAGQVSPAISGDRVVWVDFRVGNGEVYMYDVSTGTESRISASGSSGGVSSPAISGDRIVWVDFRHDYWGDVYLYDLSTGTETRITTGLARRYDTRISGDRIVWREADADYNNEVVLYDLSTSTETQITSDSYEQSSPDISGDRIVWAELRSGNREIYLYDLSTSTKTQITATPSNKVGPVISGDRIVWWDYRNGKGDIYLYDLSTSTETRITTDEASPDQGAPAISGDRIAWTDYRDGNGDIYLYDPSTSTETLITNNTSNQSDVAVSGDRMVWQDERNGLGNYDIYMYSFVSSPDVMLESLIAEAEATDGVSRGSLNKLFVAVKHLEAGRTTPAVNSLEEFIQDVQDQIGKKIAEADASALIAAAQAIIDAVQSSS